MKKLIRAKLRNFLGIEEVESITKARAYALITDDTFIKKQLGQAFVDVLENKKDGWYHRNIFYDYVNENIRKISDEHIKTTVNEYLKSEEFIDKLVDRIKRKQLQ